jgi:hypothetical protein
VITVEGPAEQRDLAERAAAVVEKHVGRIGRVQLVFTDSRGMADVHARAEIALMPQMAADVRNNRVKALRREARGLAGVTLFGTTAGSSIVLINTSRLSRRQVAPTLTHELTHSVQFTNPQNRNAHLRYLRHACGIEPISETEFRQYMRHMDQQEKEGKRAERLARHLK